MKRRFLPIFLVILMLLASGTVYATETLASPINDTADLLTEEDETILEELYARLEADYGIRAMVLTVASLDGVGADQYANDYYDRNFYGGSYDLLLLVDSGGRYYYLLAEGGTNRDAYLDRIEEAFVPYLWGSNYGLACRAYLMTAYDEAYRLFDEGSGDTELLVPILIVLAISLLIAWGVTASMRRKMKTARAKAAAHDYVKRDSFNLREKTDLYLYRTRTRVRINNNSSSGGSRSGGSGGSRGGRGGSF